MYKYTKHLLTSIDIGTEPAQSQQQRWIQFQSIKMDPECFSMFIRAAMSIDQFLQQQDKNIVLYSDSVPHFAEQILFDMLMESKGSYYNNNVMEEICSLVLQAWIQSTRTDRTQRIVTIIHRICIFYQQQKYPDDLDPSIDQYTYKPASILDTFIHCLLTTTNRLDEQYREENINIAVTSFLVALEVTPKAITNKSLDMILTMLLPKRQHEMFFPPATSTSVSTLPINNNYNKNNYTIISNDIAIQNRNNNITNNLSWFKIKNNIDSIVQEEETVVLKGNHLIPKDMIEPYIQNVHKTYLRAFEFIKGVGTRIILHNKKTSSYDVRFNAKIHGAIHDIIENLSNPWRFVMTGDGDNANSKNNSTNVTNEMCTKQQQQKTELDDEQLLYWLACDVWDFLLYLHRDSKNSQYVPERATAWQMFNLHTRYKNLDKAFTMLPMLISSHKRTGHSRVRELYKNRIDSIIEESLSLTVYGSDHQEGYTNFVLHIDEISTILTRLNSMSNRNTDVEDTQFTDTLQHAFRAVFSCCRSIPISMIRMSTTTDSTAVDNSTTISSNNRDQSPMCIEARFSLMDNLLETRLKIKKELDSDENVIESFFSFLYAIDSHNSTGQGHLTPTNIEYATYVLLRTKYRQYEKCWKILVQVLQNTRTIDSNFHSSIQDKNNSATETTDLLNDDDSIPIFYDTFINSVVSNNGNTCDNIVRMLTMMTVNNNTIIEKSKNHQYLVHVQKHTNYALFAILRLLLELNDDTSKELYVTLKVFNTVANMSRQIKQHLSHNTYVKDNDTKSIDIAVLYDLLYQLISKHRRDPMFKPLEPKFDQMLQIISEELRYYNNGY
jgi:hypothetical protein